MHILDDWDLCAFHRRSPYEMEDFYCVKPNLLQKLCINATVIDEDGEEIIFMVGSINKIEQSGDTILIHSDNDEKYILGDIRPRYEYEFGYKSGEVLEKLIHIYKIKGNFINANDI